MSALLVLLVLGPAAISIAVAVFPDHARAIGAATAAGAAVGWAFVTAADAPVEAADLVADPLLGASAVGLCLLVLSGGSRTATGVGASLLVLTLVPGGAALDAARLPDRRLAVAIAVAGLLAAVRLLSERGPRLGQLVVVIAGVVLATGLVGDDPAEALALGVAGTLVAVVGASGWGAPGRLLVPVALLVVARAAALRAPDPDLDLALLVVAAVVVAGAVALFAAGPRSIADRLPLAAVLASAGLLALDVPDLRAAGALVGAGAVLALAGGHPLALLALLPGLAAAVGTAGLATEPEQAAVGAAVVAVLAVGALGAAGRARSARLRTLGTGIAAAFAVVPLWGWSGAATDPYLDAVTVAAAVALVTLVVAGLVLASPARSAVGRDGWAGAAGRMLRRPPADPSHGTTPLAEPSAEEAHREEAGAPSP